MLVSSHAPPCLFDPAPPPASPLQVLQAMGYPTGFDSDLDPMSSDEKSDGEGKSESTTSSSSHGSHNHAHLSSDGSNTLEVGGTLASLRP